MHRIWSSPCVYSRPAEVGEVRLEEETVTVALSVTVAGSDGEFIVMVEDQTAFQITAGRAIRISMS